MVVEIHRPRAEGALVSCTDLDAAKLVPELEHDLGKPVITSNQATYWACRRRLGLPPVNGLGLLMLVT